MKTVGYLFGGRGARAAALGIDTVPVSADDPHSGMFPQPFCKGSSGSMRQQIGHDALLQIHQDCSIAVASLAPCPVIYTHHRNAWGRQTGLCRSLYRAHQRIPAASNAQACHQPLSGSASQSIGDLLDDSAASIGLSPVSLSHLVQPLAEDLPRTAPVL